MSHLDTLVQAFALERKYEAAKKLMDDSGELSEFILKNNGLGGLVDAGEILASSFEDPGAMMRASDLLMDHARAVGDDELLSDLLNCTAMSADRFVPKLSLTPAPVGVEAKAEAVGLVLSLFIETTVVTEETELEELVDDDHTQVEFAGIVTVYDNDEIHYAKNKSTEILQVLDEPSFADVDVMAGELVNEDASYASSDQQG